jgi:hypothetical protein
MGLDDNGQALKGTNGMDVYVESNHGDFWRNYNSSGVDIPDDNNRDLVFPAVLNGTTLNTTATNDQPHANVNIRGNTQLKAGSAIQMAAGYERTGKGLGSGGAALVYDISVHQIGQNNSESTLCIKYMHNLGSKGDCYY